MNAISFLLYLKEQELNKYLTVSTLDNKVPTHREFRKMLYRMGQLVTKIFQFLTDYVQQVEDTADVTNDFDHLKDKDWEDQLTIL